MGPGLRHGVLLIELANGGSPLINLKCLCSNVFQTIFAMILPLVGFYGDTSSLRPIC
jgi:hypothetical protein